MQRGTGNQSISVLSPDDTPSPLCGFLEDRGLFRQLSFKTLGVSQICHQFPYPAVGIVKLCASVQIKLIAVWAAAGFQPTKCHFCLQAVLTLSFTWCSLLQGCSVGQQPGVTAVGSLAIGCVHVALGDFS